MRRMPMFNVAVKWGKMRFNDVEVNTDESPELFKAQLFALTSVAPERQKVMLKGSVLKDDDWSNMKLKNGCMLMMMGTATEIPQAPQEKMVFMEDLTESQLAATFKLPTGLTNLDNTCYMNATVQCLCTVPELTEGLESFRSKANPSLFSSGENTILVGLQDTWKRINDSADDFPPFFLLHALFQAFPHFAEKNEQGIRIQQDANECWTQFIRILQQQVPGVVLNESDKNNAEEAGATASATARQKSLIDQYFGVEFRSTLKCSEAPEEPESTSSETLYQLSCFIDKDVKYMHTGLKNRLQETISKHSPSLGRDANYTKSSLLDRLPAYLSIQFVRFYYKEKEKINAKILKDVKYPLILDVFDLCSPELQKKIIPMRDRFKIRDDTKLEEEKKAKLENKKARQEGMDVDKNETKEHEPYWFPEDIGSNNSGLYELQAVLTHQGRSSSSGHYVAWIRRHEDSWVKCDDDKISLVTAEEVLKLSGGGDWHCAYVLLYGPRKLEIIKDAS